MPDQPTSLAFAGRGRELVVSIAADVDADAFRKAAGIFLPGWEMRDMAPTGKPDISVTFSQGLFTIRAESWPGGESVAADPNNAANALAGLLIDAVLAHGMAAYCLHAAAAEIGGRAILFAGRAQAGKSTLALRLAARGRRHLSDDRILLLDESSPYRVGALGLSAKARKPLPPGKGLTDLVEMRWHMVDETIAYLHLEHDEAARFGDELPLGAIIVPRRREVADTVSLRHAAPGDIARTLIEETTSPAGPGAIVAAMTQLADNVEGYILEYEDGEAAADALLAKFDG